MNRQHRSFSITDRIYARLMVNGKQIAEYMLDGIGSMSDLLWELRALTRRYKGLVRLYVRNMSKGWSLQQPLMLYAGKFDSVRDADTASVGRSMLMPWEINA